MHSVASVERGTRATIALLFFPLYSYRLDDPLSDIRYFALGDAHEMPPPGFKGNTARVLDFKLEFGFGKRLKVFSFPFPIPLFPKTEQVLSLKDLF